MAARLATEGVSLVVGRFEALGLRVALDNVEALLFHWPAWHLQVGQLGPRASLGPDEVSRPDP